MILILLITKTSMKFGFSGSSGRHKSLKEGIRIIFLVLYSLHLSSSERKCSEFLGITFPNPGQATGMKSFYNFVQIETISRKFSQYPFHSTEAGRFQRMHQYSLLSVKHIRVRQANRVGKLHLRRVGSMDKMNVQLNHLRGITPILFLLFHFLKKGVHININANSVLEYIIVLQLYTLLTILAFHKLFILGIDNVLIGDGGDAYHYVWDFWWVKKAILEGKNIFYTDYLFYPYGVFLIFHALNLSFSLLSIGFSNFLDGVVIYNLFVLSSFVISGWLMFYLLKNLKRFCHLFFNWYII